MIVWFLEAAAIGAVMMWIGSMIPPGIKLIGCLILISLFFMGIFKMWDNGLLPQLTCAVVHDDFMEACHVPPWDWDNYKQAKREHRKYVIPADAYNYGPYDFKP